MTIEIKTLMAQESAFVRALEAFEIPKQKYDLERVGYVGNLNRAQAAVSGLKEHDVISLTVFKAMTAEERSAQESLKEHDRCRPTWTQKSVSEYTKLKSGLVSVRKQINQLTEIKPTQNADVITFPVDRIVK